MSGLSITEGFTPLSIRYALPLSHRFVVEIHAASEFLDTSRTDGFVLSVSAVVGHLGVYDHSA